MSKRNKLYLALVICGSLMTGAVFANPDLTTTAPQVTNNKIITFQVIKQQLIFTKSDIKSVKLIKNPGSIDAVQITLTNKAAQQLTTLTSNNIHKRMALVVNNKIISAPVIQSSLGSKFVITFQSNADANALYQKIQS